MFLFYTKRKFSPLLTYSSVISNGLNPHRKPAFRKKQIQTKTRHHGHKDRHQNQRNTIIMTTEQPFHYLFSNIKGVFSPRSTPFPPLSLTFFSKSIYVFWGKVVCFFGKSSELATRDPLVFSLKRTKRLNKS